jgi:DNA polymerase-3 subunit gamma/tau
MTDDSAPADPASGPGLFGDALPAPGGYLVLARKYRPQRFEDLIGQEAMVRTIANAFALKRIPHAYMLTGVRGVGKTTTARLIARALNYESATIREPSVALDPLGVHCPEIIDGAHPDILEMDAASRTGVGDIREVLEGVRYAAASARFKVYIIDEVHMLSTAAFNALLKTLEEPPPHVKFIFATTEIRKVPVTVLSRCQRFDLKRVPPDRLAAHLAAICAREGAAVAPEGLALIARAAEGSVRDALSLLDQAIVQRTGAEAVSAAQVRDMLGLADRSRVLDLFEALAKGDARTALLEARSQYDAGADPAQIVRDLGEVTHDIARRHALGAEAAAGQAADQAARIETLAGALTPGRLSILWQMLLKALEDCARAPEPIAAAEMAFVRIAAAAGLPPPEEAARLLREGPPREADPPTATAAPGAHAQNLLANFEDVVALIGAKRERGLELEVERYVRLVSFAPNEIVYAPTPGAPEDLPMRLARKLEGWTGEAWSVSAAGEGGVESLAERRKAAERAEKAAAAAHPFVAEALAVFPGADILSIVKPAPESPAEVSSLPRPPGPQRKEKPA